MSVATAPAETISGDLSWPLARAAMGHREQIAVIDGARSLTYGELSRRVSGLGSALDQLELARGARVAFLGANSLAHLECWLGVPAAGRVLVDLNTRLAAAELAFILADCEPELLIVDATTLELARTLRASSPQLRALVYDGPQECPSDCVPYEGLVEHAPGEARGVAADALATISYTGGTTGRPKGVMLSHANLLANARHHLIACGHSDADRWLHVCPMFHVAGTSNILAATWVGARHVILPRFSAEAVAVTIAREGITHMVLVPTMLAMLLEQLERQPADLRSLREVQYAASPISPELQRRVLAALPCELAQYYGMTEAAPTVCHLTPGDHRRGLAGEEPYRARLSSVGVPVVGVQAEIRDAHGREVASGEVGEVWVRGPNVMLGYWRRPAETADALRDGWYRTGDAGRVDDEGYLYLVDRMKDMIISGAENVYSIEVEAALLEHASVSEAAVFGVPDERWGEAVHAVVVPREGFTLDPEELVSHCRARIAGYKVPRTIEVRTVALPRSAAGKLLKRDLREPFWRGRERRVS